MIEYGLLSVCVHVDFTLRKKMQVFRISAPCTATGTGDIRDHHMIGLSRFFL